MLRQQSLESCLRQASASRKRRRDDDSGDVERARNTKMKAKEKSTPATTRTLRSLWKDNKTASQKPAAVQTAGFGAASQEAGPSALRKSPSIDTDDVTLLDSPPRLGRTQRPYLPTPTTMTRPPKGRQTASSAAGSATSKRNKASNQQPAYVATPALGMSRYPSPLPTPVTPTKRRGVAKTLVPSSSLSSLPATPVQQLYPNISPTARVSIRDGASRATVPSSQTQVLETNPFLSTNTRHAHQDAKFKTPAPPSHAMVLPSIPSSTLIPDYQDEELCVVPSSQTQELVLTKSFVSPMRPPQRHSFDVRLRMSEEIIPDSQLTELDVVNTPPRTPRRGRQPSISPSRRHAIINSASTSTTCPDHEVARREIVPTSQSAEKEMTSSDYFGMKARISTANGVPTAAKRTGLDETEDTTRPSITDVITRSPTRTRFLPSPTNPRTPSRRDRTFGQDVNIEVSPSGRTCASPDQKLPVTPRTPRTPRVRFFRDKIAEDGEAIPRSSQTEPELSQWHIPTQYTPLKRGIESSQTEPESPRWRVPTQSSITEPEPSQWHVPTQLTPRSHRQFSIPPVNEDEPPYAPFSLPVASYDVGDGGDDPPPEPSISPRSKSAILSAASADKTLPPTVDSQEPRGIPGASSFGNISQISDGAWRRLHFMRTRLGGLDIPSQDTISSAPLSIPSDYNDAFPGDLSQSQAN